MLLSLRSRLAATRVAARSALLCAGSSSDLHASPSSCTTPRRAWISSSRAVQGEFSDVLHFETIQPPSQTLTPEDFKHKAVLVVNTASRCGYTPQLKQLQALHEQFAPRGLVVLAVPSNAFGNQEPGSDDEILRFYTSDDYNVSFPIAKKADVTGDNAHEFFERIAVEYSRSVAPTWNFDKFLIDHHGDLRAVFPHDTEPLLPQVLEAIEEVLDDLPRSLAPEEDEEDEEDDDEEETSETSAAAPSSNPPSPSN